MVTRLLVGFLLLLPTLPAAAGSPSAQAIEELRARIDALTERVTALEAAPPPLRPVLVDSDGQLVGYPLGAPHSFVNIANGYRNYVPEFPVIIFSNDGRAWSTFATVSQLVVPSVPFAVQWWYVERDCAGTPYLRNQPDQLNRFAQRPPGVSNEMFAAGVFRASDEAVEIPHPNSYWVGGCLNINSHPGGTIEARLPESVELAPAVGLFHFEVR
jgi:hypothetical protein